MTLLREFRGDGHVAALLVADVDGCEALVSHAAAGRRRRRRRRRPPVTRGPGPTTSGRRPRTGCASRGWIDGDGRFTDKGAAAREQIEAATDERAMAPWKALGEDAADQLRAQVRPWSRTIASSGLFTAGP